MNACRTSNNTGTQRGSVLIVALMLLLVLTILGVTAMNNMTLEQRMAVSYQRTEEAFNASQDEVNDEMRRWNNKVDGYVLNDDYIRQAEYTANAAPRDELCTTPFTRDRAVAPAEQNSGTNITVTMSTVYQGGKAGTLLMPATDAENGVAETYNITADARVTVGSATIGRSTQTQTVVWVRAGTPLPCPEPE